MMYEEAQILIPFEAETRNALEKIQEANWRSDRLDCPAAHEGQAGSEGEVNFETVADQHRQELENGLEPQATRLRKSLLVGRRLGRRLRRSRCGR